jgi:LytS/YehU family sensor histidine kinase
VSVVASAIGTVLLVAVGFTPAAVALRLFQEALPTATYFTLLFGMATSFVSEAKERDTADTRRLVAEAQLASLESRVNPHFLFNTLNSIAAMTHTDPPGAERMTHQLASLMRSSLDAASTPLVSLRAEVDLVRDYLAIEGVRFGPRLRYTIDIDERAADTPVPRLALQTLVENSVKYAVSTQRDGACLAIRAVANGASTRVEVEDDGPGFDPGQEVPGHGLALLRARLAMGFQHHARLDVQSRPGRTRVAIVVPARGVSPA